MFDARTVWVSDIDKGACKILAHRFPHAPNLGDITRIDWSTVEPVDIIAGGYPCQPFSQAGRRLGQEDERHLWHYVADAIAALRPPLVVFENVRGHLSLGFDEVIRDLHQLGYNVEWVLIKASDLGACHQRARLFILGVNRERRVRSWLDRRGGLDRHQQDGSQHVCDPCPGGDGHEGHAHPALHEGRVRWQDREASGGDGAARREGRLGRGWAGGGDVLGGDPAASDPQERAGRVCAGPVGFDPGVAESARAQALDRRTPSPCPPPHAQGAGIECAWAGSASAGTAEGSRTDRPVPLGRVVGDGGEPVWPDTIRGKLPDEWEHDRGAPVRCAGADLPGDGSGVPHERDRDALRVGPDRALTLLPTPTSNIGQNGGPQHPAKRRAGGHSVSIEDAVHGLAFLPTPRATRGGSTTETSRLLPTPSVADTQGGRKHRSGDRSGELLLNGLAHHEQFDQYAAAIARQERAFGYPAPSPTEPAAKPLNRHGNPRVNPRLSARFVEWMMMLPAGWITDVPGVTRTEALRACGNGVVPQQAMAALRIMLDRAATPSTRQERDHERPP